MPGQVLVTGATGLIGRNLIRNLLTGGYSIIAVGRDLQKLRKVFPAGVSHLPWNGRSRINGLAAFGKITHIIHLMGAGVADKRWDEEYKKEILESRTISTANLVESLKTLEEKPSAFISSSATGYYGNTGEKEITERSPRGSGFLSDVCAAWEDEAKKSMEYGIRWVSVRSGIVLDANSGAFPRMILPFKYFIGGKLGKGRQWFSWIHIKDLVSLYRFALERDGLTGAINGTAPNPVRMEDLAKVIGYVLHRPTYFAVPEFMLKAVMGEAATEITKSQKVVPERLLQMGFKYQFTNIESAVNDLLKM